MFDSGITASNLIEQIKDEADIALPVSDEIYISWLNALEQLLYTEVIQEQGKIEIDGVGDKVINISALAVPDGENAVRFEDIYAVYCDTTQLIKSTVASGVIFPNTYYKTENNLGLNLTDTPETIKIIYFVKPKLKTPENISSESVRLPVEFIDLAKAKLRGEAYKMVNEGDIAAMWLNDYNILLETFKAWIAEKRPSFGL